MDQHYAILKILLTDEQGFPEVDNGVHFKAFLFATPKPTGIAKKLQEYYTSCRVLDPQVNGIHLGHIRVTVDSKEGVVERLIAGVDSFEVNFSGEKKFMTLSEVRNTAQPHQGVVSQEDDWQKFTVFLMSTYFEVYVHVAEFISVDN